MNLTEENKEQKDLNTKRFEERLAEMKANGFKVIDLDDTAGEKEYSPQMQRIQDILKQHNNVSTVLDRHFKLQDELASIASNKPKKVDYVDPRQQYQERLEAIAEAKDRKEREEREYRESVISELQGIKHNVATLQDINYHLQLNTAQQKEIFDLIVEILAIVKSSNQEEAKGKFEKVTEKIKSLTSLKDSWETVQWLLTMANSAYIAYQSAPHIPIIKP